jgi:Putative zinc-finger
MNHPTREELTLHLLGEAPVEIRRRVAEHLQTCPGCNAQAAAWRGTMRRLDTWRLRPPSAGRDLWSAPVWRWTAAAALVLAIGFALGRGFSPSDGEGDRQGLTADLRKEIQESIQQLTSKVESGRAEDLRAIRALLVELEEQRTAEYAALRQDLETVATFTDEEIRDARRRLTMLAQVQSNADDNLQQ